MSPNPDTAIVPFHDGGWLWTHVYIAACNYWKVKHINIKHNNESPLFAPIPSFSMLYPSLSHELNYHLNHLQAGRRTTQTRDIFLFWHRSLPLGRITGYGGTEARHALQKTSPVCGHSLWRANTNYILQSKSYWNTNIHKLVPETPMAPVTMPLLVPSVQGLLIIQ